MFDLMRSSWQLTALISHLLKRGAPALSESYYFFILAGDRAFISRDVFCVITQGDRSDLVPDEANRVMSYHDKQG